MDIPTYVRCQLAADTIPVSLCFEEQGSNACRGCTAASRRCAVCGQANGIADPKAGVCETCQKVDERKARKSQKEEPVVSGRRENLDDALTLVREGLAEIGQNDLTSLEMLSGAVRTHPKQSKPLVMSTKVHQIDALFALLCEHIVVRGGVNIISSPIATLMDRVRLLPQEAKIVLDKLVERGMITPQDDQYDCIQVLVDDLPETQQEVEEGQHSVKRSAPKLRDRPVLRSSTKPQEAMRIPTIGEVYAELLGRYREVAGERVVGGAIPFLQLKFKLSPQLSERVLERLREERLIDQRDGWRTVSLLADTIEDTRPAVGELVLSRLKERAARAKIRLRSGTSIGHILKTTIASLQETVQQLREVRERVQAQLEPLEHVLEELRVVRRELEDSEVSAKQALELTDKAAEALDQLK